MSGEIEIRLKNLGITLPSPPSPLATYASSVIEGRLLYISGQLPLLNGELQFKGKVGTDLSLEEAQEAACLCALNIIAQVKLACEESFERVTRCVRLGGFVNASESFTDHPKVINSASQLVIDVFGNFGKHTRTAVGVNSLPLGAAVEIDAIFALEEISSSQGL